MKVILISDPLATKSVISVDVGVGNLHSPKKFDGLALFVQHMLLVGSQKYPDKKKNDEFFKQFGGNLNAFTSMNNTNYQLEIDHNGFEEGVDRFANFFIAPNFNEEEKEREIRQIGHKFKRAIVDDETKHLNLWCSLSNPDSITNKLIFCQKDKCNDPESMEAAKQFFDAYYSSSNMTLCMSSNLALNDLEKVAKSFKEIKFKKLELPYQDLPDPYGPDFCRRVIRMHSDREEP
jgi:secreted Zn-dependent insulinase-like peptidase